MRAESRHATSSARGRPGREAHGRRRPVTVARIGVDAASTAGDFDRRDAELRRLIIKAACYRAARLALERTPEREPPG